MRTESIPQTSLREHLDLPAIRKNKGITLDQIAESSKIRLRYLQAIEEGRFDKLPGGIFNISYIRQYARAIDLDERDLLAYYDSLTHTAESTNGNGSGATTPAPVLKRFRQLLLSPSRP